MTLRLGFAGTPDFAATILHDLLQYKHVIDVVYSQPDRKQGRGQILQASHVKECALAHNLSIQQPPRFDAQAIATLADYQLDLLIVAAYGLILPQAVLDLPRLGCINVHASLLPEFRGASPIAASLLSGQKHTGISLMQMEAGLDTGPVFVTESVPISPTDDGASLTKKLAKISAPLLHELLQKLATGSSCQPQAQMHNQASYAPKIKKTDACIDWNEPAQNLERMIRAYLPWPVAYTEKGAHRLRLFKAKTKERHSPQTKPGTITATSNQGIDIQTGSGTLCITEWQLPGKKVTLASQDHHHLPAWLQPGASLT
jgi:methionyl-tRNA formyltransferase